MQHITNDLRLNAMAEFCKKTYGYNEQDYCLTEECGEVIQLLMKLQRSDISNEKKEYLIKEHLPEELGQVLYMIDGILDKYHLTLEDCGQAVKDRFFNQFGIEDPLERIEDINGSISN